jgi:NAD(P)-dependent dehydrogenase (short-subunit alcohol dehydrogenase family)
MHPLGRIGAPADIASAIAWLIDPANSWVTAQILAVDGGLGSLKVGA